MSKKKITKCKLQKKIEKLNITEQLTPKLEAKYKGKIHCDTFTATNITELGEYEAIYINRH